MEERRQVVRVMTPVLVEFPHPVTLKTERSFTQDVSERGLRFPTAVKLQMGQEMALTLELPFQNAEIHATGQVVWLREVAQHGGPQYEVGIHFRWIEDPDRQRLIHHLATLLHGRF